MQLKIFGFIELSELVIILLSIQFTAVIADLHQEYWLLTISFFSAFNLIVFCNRELLKLNLV